MYEESAIRPIYSNTYFTENQRKGYLQKPILQPSNKRMDYESWEQKVYSPPKETFTIK